MRQNISGKSKNPQSSFKSFAITSLVIGIFTIVTMCVTTVLEDLFGGDYIISFGEWMHLPFWFYALLSLVSFIGFIFGIVGLWSKRKIVTIVGIILCSWGIYWTMTKPIHF